MNLKEVRKSKGLTQTQAAKLCSVSLRSYSTFENDADKEHTLKYQYMLDTIEKYGVIDETHGILDIDRIKEKCVQVFSQYDISYCYLFGSYAKGKASESSDVDLLISTPVTGLRFFGMAEELRDALGKKTDVLDSRQLVNNPELTEEILKTGVKIYG
ncbi:MAG: nucleotidyltransferase domain-containing protein [Clostridia bacterium]|nr:nucleotidyltransferase domain-containing protein [Clostridia bacterium]